MWKEFDANRVERIGNKQIILLNDGIEMIDFDNGKVSWSPFSDLGSFVTGLAWNIMEGKRLSTIHNDKLYFIAASQEGYTIGNAVEFIDLKIGEFGHCFYMSERMSEMELSDIMFDTDDACFCIGTVRKGEGYTQCMLCPEVDIIWGVNRHTGEIDQINNIDDLADNMRILVEDHNDGDVNFSMGSADVSESDYKKYKAFTEIVIEDKNN